MLFKCGDKCSENKVSPEQPDTGETLKCDNKECETNSTGVVSTKEDDPPKRIYFDNGEFRISCPKCDKQPCEQRY